MTAKAYIEVTANGASRRYALSGKPITIGRHPQNALVITDEQASRKHCVIERTTDGYQVRDLDSRNGTYINGDRTRASQLRSDDRVRIGDTEIRFVDAAKQAADKASSSEGSIDLAPDQVEENQPAKRLAPRLGSGKRAKVKVKGESDDEADILKLAKAHCASVAQMLEGVPGESTNPTGIRLINARGQQLTVEDDDENGGALNVLRALLAACMHLRATDLHIEPKRDDYQTRVRVDGIMIEVLRQHKVIATRLTSVVKVLSDIDIAQRQIVQEGTFTIELPNRRVDYRVSFTPTTFGQKLVVRVLDLANAPQYLSEMHAPPWTHKALKQVMQQDTGMVLVSGPTGSGKTTSLYALIREIDIAQRNVVTIEDPVEYHIEGVTQIPINEMQGNNFSNVLRSVLRQDPDVILVGEIRDSETARIAMQAAITGHLVLSTVHARDTIGAIFRLLDLGVEPYVLGTGLNMVLAQRLVRKLCQNCRIDKMPVPEETRRMGLSIQGLGKIYKSADCDKCLHTGYLGRRAIFELLIANEQLRDVILANPTIQDLKVALQRTMFSTLAENGYKLVAEGVTSIDEIDRVVGSVE